MKYMILRSSTQEVQRYVRKFNRFLFFACELKEGKLQIIKKLIIIKCYLWLFITDTHSSNVSLTEMYKLIEPFLTNVDTSNKHNTIDRTDITDILLILVTEMRTQCA